MTEHLFVYGTLAPGRPNEHVLRDVAGRWRRASVSGRLVESGWGSALGYHALEPAEGGERVQGWVFSSDVLGEQWTRLDEFEGDEYERVSLEARLEDGGVVAADTYVVARSSRGGPCRDSGH